MPKATDCTFCWASTIGVTELEEVLATGFLAHTTKLFPIPSLSGTYPTPDRSNIYAVSHGGGFAVKFHFRPLPVLYSMDSQSHVNRL
ncbi:hypothetical protein PG996_004466 [Apiospora saccharicola]|uniref:Uncharacterized protein n=1 Tax=Apiospora saccharicola TaxID=335842 RepID=A0ABR1W487_9PEZI